MNHRSISLAAAAAVAVGGVFAAGGAWLPALAAGPTPCTGTLPPGTYQDVVVPSGASCILGSGVTVNHDVTVNKAGSLSDSGASVGHDIQASQPNSIDIGHGATVGHDLHVTGTTGVVAPAFPFNDICNATVGHDLVITGSASAATSWIIGDSDGPAGCARGVGVGHDMNVTNNATAVDVSENSSAPASHGGSIGHDLNVTGNAGPTFVEGNQVGHDANCSAPTTSPGDGDFTPNTTGHNNSCG